MLFDLYIVLVLNRCNSSMAIQKYVLMAECSARMQMAILPVAMGNGCLNRTVIVHVLIV